jgi:hypothetical protein
VGLLHAARATTPEHEASLSDQTPKKSGAQNGGIRATDTFGKCVCAGGGKDPGVAVSALGVRAFNRSEIADML